MSRSSNQLTAMETQASSDVSVWKRVIGRFLESARKRTVAALIFLGFALLFLSVVVQDFTWWIITADRVRSALSTAGAAILGAGVFAAVVKTSLFLEVFSGVLFDVIYGDRLLRSRSDIREVWERVSMVYSDWRFGGIAQRVLEDMRVQYIEKPKKYFLRNYRWRLTLNRVDSATTGQVRATSRIMYTIVTGDPAIGILLKPSVYIPRNREEWGEEKTTTFAINEQDRLSEWRDLDYNDAVSKGKVGEWHIYWDKALSGNTEYRLIRIQERIFNASRDPIIRQISTNMLDQPDVEVIVEAAGLEAEFYAIGTPRDWEPTVKYPERDYRTAQIGRNLEMFYPGIVFPEQGFMLVLKCKGSAPNT